jgi:hypothetical protein
MYLVQYSTGDWADHVSHYVFVTEDEEKAKKFVAKFNDLVSKWSDYYNSLDLSNATEEKKRNSNVWQRRRDFNDINNAFYTEIELR